LQRRKKSALCAAAGTLENGAQVKFMIRTKPNRAEEDARIMSDYLNDLVRALSISPSQE
jgi:hypothetical protein